MLFQAKDKGINILQLVKKLSYWLISSHMIEFCPLLLADVQVRPSEKTWGSMYAMGRLEIEEDGTANMEIINQTILEYNLAEGELNFFTFDSDLSLTQL